MKLSELKSAREITDRSEIVHNLELGLKNSPMLGMSLVKGADSSFIVRKKNSSSLILRDAPVTPDVNGLKALAELHGFPWVEEYANRVVPYWASDERVDGHGDIIMQNWDFSEYESSPVIQYCHQWEEPPIGGCLDWRVAQRVDDKYDGPALYLLPFFATEDQSEEADSIYRLVRARIMRAGSVGFYSRKMISVQDPAEREALGLGAYGYILDDNVLVEFSPCPIGANAGALTIMSSAKQKGILRAKDMSCLRELNRQQALREGSKDTWKSTDSMLCAFNRVLFPEAEVKAAKDIDAPIFSAPSKESWLPKTRKSSVIEIPVQAPVKKDIVTVEEKLDSFIGFVTDALTGMSAALEDIRTLIETVLPDVPVDPQTDPAPAGPAVAGSKNFLAGIVQAAGRLETEKKQ